MYILLEYLRVLFDIMAVKVVLVQIVQRILLNKVIVFFTSVMTQLEIHGTFHVVCAHMKAYFSDNTQLLPPIYDTFPLLFSLLLRHFGHFISLA